MASLTRRGALSVTTDLDRIASLFQSHHDDLGVPKEYAVKFAYYCDVMSDAVEKHALSVEKLAEETEKDQADDEGAKKEAGCEKLPEALRKNCEEKAESADDKKDEDSKKEASSKVAGVDETGGSVDHGAAGFDANQIGDVTSNPVEAMAPAESWMSPFFSQKWFSQLREKQTSGDIGFFVSASTARLRRLAAISQLSAVVDALKVILAKVEASELSEVKGLAADVKKMVDGVSKIHDLTIEQQAVGMVEPMVVAAADHIMQAVAEVVPYLQQVVAGVDAGSPVALLEFQKALSGGSVKELVSLAAGIVADAAKSISPKADESKAASEDEAPKAEEKKDESETAAKKAEDEAPKAEDEKKDEGADKAASYFGYNLFAN